MLQSPSSPDNQYRDSGKVLMAIQGIIDRHEEVVTPIMGKSAEGALREYEGGLTALSTLNLIKEEMRNAPKTIRIYKKT